MTRSLILLLASFSGIQSCERKPSPTSHGINSTQQQSQRDPKARVLECDFSSFKALKMHSLPAVSLITPTYPAEAKDRRIGGTVHVKVIVDEKGTVLKACVIEGDESLRKAAEAAALEAKFKPGLWNSYLAERYDYAEFIITYNFVP